ncbi:HIT family protein [Candidatus Bipolaricaulota bacterium]|nr:HIT family protein [Candidatus Bipolaricaulota bacterium]
MSDCIFCDIIEGVAPASIVYRDDHVCAFLDIQPVNAGHLLVIPTGHATDLADLDPAAGSHLFRIAQRLAAALRRTSLAARGVNLVLADGEAAGQEVFHVHLHVIPRFTGDGFGFTFGPDYSNLPPREALDRVAATLRDALGE